MKTKLRGEMIGRYPDGGFTRQRMSKMELSGQKKEEDLDSRCSEGEHANGWCDWDVTGRC